MPTVFPYDGVTSAQDSDAGNMVSGAILSNIKLAAELSPRTQRTIAERVVQVDYGPGVELYRQGDPPSPVHMLLSGRVKLYRQSRDRCQILALPSSGDSIGAESLPTGGTSPYTATTLTQVRALVISTGDLQVLLDELPDFQEAFLRLITERLKQFVTLVHDLAFRDVTSRLAMVLVARAEVEGRPQDGGVVFDRLLSQQEYADVVGTAREVVYRTFKRFEDDGLVSMTRRHILVRDLDSLRLIGQQEAR